MAKPEIRRTPLCTSAAAVARIASTSPAAIRRNNGSTLGVPYRPTAVGTVPRPDRLSRNPNCARQAGRRASDWSCPMRPELAPKQQSLHPRNDSTTRRRRPVWESPPPIRDKIHSGKLLPRKRGGCRDRRSEWDQRDASNDQGNLGRARLDKVRIVGCDPCRIGQRHGPRRGAELSPRCSSQKSVGSRALPRYRPRRRPPEPCSCFGGRSASHCPIASVSFRSTSGAAVSLRRPDSRRCSA